MVTMLTYLIFLYYNNNNKCFMTTEIVPICYTKQLNLIIDNLPVIEGRLLCVFTAFGKTQVTNATRSSNGVSCPTPASDTLPIISPGQRKYICKGKHRFAHIANIVSRIFVEECLDSHLINSI